MRMLPAAERYILLAHLQTNPEILGTQHYELVR